MTLSYEDTAHMVHAVCHEMGAHGISIGGLKNRFAFPTAMGYSDVNMSATLSLANGTKYIVEVQINHPEMIRAKEAAHPFYEIMRSKLPKLCVGTCIEPGELEKAIVDAINDRPQLAAMDLLMERVGSTADVLYLAEEIGSLHKQGRNVTLDDLMALPPAPDASREQHRRQVLRQTKERFQGAMLQLNLAKAEIVEQEAIRRTHAARGEVKLANESLARKATAKTSAAERVAVLAAEKLRADEKMAKAVEIAAALDAASAAEQAESQRFSDVMTQKAYLGQEERLQLLQVDMEKKAAARAAKMKADEAATARQDAERVAAARKTSLQFAQQALKAATDAKANIERSVTNALVRLEVAEEVEKEAAEQSLQSRQRVMTVGGSVAVKGAAAMEVAAAEEAAKVAYEAAALEAEQKQKAARKAGKQRRPRSPARR